MIEVEVGETVSTEDEEVLVVEANVADNAADAVDKSEEVVTATTVALNDSGAVTSSTTEAYVPSSKTYNNNPYKTNTHNNHKKNNHKKK